MYFCVALTQNASNESEGHNMSPCFAFIFSISLLKSSDSLVLISKPMFAITPTIASA